MDSGIYRLTYRTGETYVGKSIHLSVRWKQHFDKLVKGKAAKNMQDAYVASGHQFPQTEVLLYCHPDMLDYYEGYFINHLQPPLNTSIPDELTEHAKEILIVHANNGFAKHSVITILQAINNFQNNEIVLTEQNSEISKQFKKLVVNFEKLEQSWDDRACRDNWANKDYRRAVGKTAGLEQEIADLGIEIFQLRAWQRKVKGANWWQRLWRLW